MKFKLVLLQLLVCVLCMGFNSSVHAAPITPDANGVLYVKKGGAGAVSGNGWANALGELSDALTEARALNAANAGTVKQIWVAQGTYYPAVQVDGGTDKPRRKTFSLLPDVKIYGHFQGVETSLGGRSSDYAMYITVLSGDIGSQGNSLDNAYHVVTGYVSHPGRS